MKRGHDGHLNREEVEGSDDGQPATTPKQTQDSKVKNGDSDKKDNKVTFNLPQQSEQKIADKKSLFGSSLFGNTSLFSGSTNLFGNQTAATINNPFATGPSLFSTLFNNNNNSKPLFGESTTGSLFSGVDLKSSNLFNNSKTQSSIFGQGFQFKKDQSEGEEEEGADSEEDKKSDKFDPNLSTGKFEYKNVFDKVIDKKLSKFRLNRNDLVQNLDLTIEQHKQNKTRVLIVRIPATKKILYQGTILKTHSTLRVLHNKDQNLEVATFSTNEKTNKPQKDVLKLQFAKAEDGKEFSKQFNSTL